MPFAMLNGPVEQTPVRDARSIPGGHRS